MITYDKLMCARKVLERFYQTQLSGVLALKIKCFLDETQPFAVDFAQEEMRLLDLYAEKTESNIPKIISKDDTISNVLLKDKDKFKEDIESFLAQEIHYHFDEENFLTAEDFEELQCSPEEIGYLGEFIQL